MEQQVEFETKLKAPGAVRPEGRPGLPRSAISAKDLREAASAGR